MAFLTRDQILSVEDRRFQDVEVPEWVVIGSGETAMVRIVGLNAKAAAEFSSRLIKVDAKGGIQAVKIDNFLAELLSLTMTDDKFQPLFSKEDVEALGLKSAAVMKRLGDIAMQLSGLNETAVKDATKN